MLAPPFAKRGGWPGDVSGRLALESGGNHIQLRMLSALGRKPGRNFRPNPSMLFLIQIVCVFYKAANYKATLGQSVRTRAN